MTNHVRETSTFELSDDALHDTSRQKDNSKIMIHIDGELTQQLSDSSGLYGEAQLTRIWKPLAYGISYCIQPTTCLGREFKHCLLVDFTLSAEDGVRNLSGVLFFPHSHNNWEPTLCLGACASSILVPEYREHLRAIVFIV